MRFIRIIKFKIINYSKIFLTIICLLLIAFLTLSDNGKTYYNQFANKWFDYTKLQGFHIDNIYFSGLDNLSEQDILDKTLIRLSQPVFSVDLENMKNKILEFDWVKNVTIQRKLPNLLFVDIEEKNPIAIWQNSGSLVIIDENGDVITQENLKKFQHLPILVGENANILAKNILSSLSENSTIKDHISAIIRVGERRWNVRFRNELEVMLPENSINNNSKSEIWSKKAWQHVLDLYDNGSLFASNIKIIDLRIKDKIYIETKK